MANHAEEVLDFLDRHWCSKMIARLRAQSGITPEAYEAAIGRLEELRRAYVLELFQMSAEQLGLAAHDAMIEQDRDRPFNRFGSDADYEHFGRCPCITADEAVALSLGKDPRMVQWSMVRPFLATSLFAYEYANRLDLVERAIVWGELPRHFSPLQFLTWAHKYKVTVPDAFVRRTLARGEPLEYWHDLCANITDELDVTKAELAATRESLAVLEEEHALQGQQTIEGWLEAQSQIDLLKSKHEEEAASLREEIVRARQEIASLRGQIAAAADRAPEEPLSTVERNSLLTIAISAAIDGFGYDPKSLKNTAPREIADAARLLGLKMTDETVLKYLKEATKLGGFVYPDTPRRKPKSVRPKPKSV